MVLDVVLIFVLHEHRIFTLLFRPSDLVSPLFIVNHNTKHLTMYACTQNEPRIHHSACPAHTPPLFTSACSPFTAFSKVSTNVLLCSFSFCVGLDSGLGISIVFDLLGLNGMGVEGREERNYQAN